MELISFYTQRYGAAVKKRQFSYNGPCPLCGGEPGKSDRFIIWPDKDESLGKACAENNIRGIWSCRRCGEGGDTIAYLTKVEGMDFKAALAELGIKGSHSSRRRRSAPKEPRPGNRPLSLKESGKPSPKWCEYAAKILDEACECIWGQPPALKWLAQRGIDADAVRTYRIGYLPPEGKCTFGRFRHRSALDLEARIQNGKEKRLFIPRGIVIPSFSLDGSVVNLRIRRHREDLSPMADGKLPPKYMELEGSSRAPMILKSSSPPVLSAYFITEAELDALLIHHASGGKVGAIAVRTNRGKPDMQAHGLLQPAVTICVALDYDDAGTQGVEFWEDNYPQAKRWPTPVGKDPGDAFAQGVNIRDWVNAALPQSIALPAPQKREDSPTIKYNGNNDNASAGHLDTFPDGKSFRGGGAQNRNQHPPKEKNLRTRASTDNKPHVAEKRRWPHVNRETPLETAQLPQGAPSLDSLRNAFAGKEIHSELVVACPKHKWWWVYYDRACSKCSGHSLCIVDFQISPQMRAPFTT